MDGVDDGVGRIKSDATLKWNVLGGVWKSLVKWSASQILSQNQDQARRSLVSSLRHFGPDISFF